MYANKVSIAASQKEGYIRFECIAPKLIDGERSNDMDVLESHNVVMSREMLKDMMKLIEKVLSEEAPQEN